MPISWNEIRHNAVAFSKDWAGVSVGDAEAGAGVGAYGGLERAVGSLVDIDEGARVLPERGRHEAEFPAEGGEEAGIEGTHGAGAPDRGWSGVEFADNASDRDGRKIMQSSGPQLALCLRKQ
jgi:hypothetical protein